MMEKMIDPISIGYDIIDYAIPLNIASKHHYQINFGNPSWSRDKKIYLFVYDLNGNRTHIS